VTAHASPTTPVETAAAARVGILLPTDSGKEQDHGDKQRGPSSPGETECVLADGSIATDRVELVAHLNEGGSHQRRRDSEEEERDRRSQAGDRRAETSTAGDEACEEGKDGEEQSDQIEYPTEPPHVEIEEARRVTAVRPNEGRRQVGASWSPCPSPTHWGIRECSAAVGVTAAADVEEGPLGDIACAGDA